MRGHQGNQDNTGLSLGLCEKKCQYEKGVSSESRAASLQDDCLQEERIFYSACY